MSAGTYREDWQLADSIGNLYFVGTSSTVYRIIKVSAAGGAVVGWASATGYRWAETPVQRAIAAAAAAASGKSSGPSYVVSQVGATTTWVTDAYGGDGQRMRNAINRYAQWYRSNPKTKTLTQIKADMFTDFSASAYNSDSKSKLVDQIVAVYNTNPNAATPTNDQQTIGYLAIRKQCLEWAETIALSSGGKARGYSAAAVGSPNLYRPGMGMYKTDHSHAMIVIDIYWDASGNPTQFRVAESNYGSGWSNPGGMIPWQRTVPTDRIIALSGNIVSYE